VRGKIAEIDGRRPVKIPVWWNYYVPFESMLTDDDVYLSGLLCYANMISVGTTCFAEAGGPHPDAMARAAIDTGIRGTARCSAPPVRHRCTRPRAEGDRADESGTSRRPPNTTSSSRT